ncbi:hypothetical protein ACH5RR_011523 [Cinchona calisaya]|uniref:F-box domain-containing protein n=1 Tax=Cinchona calisaya TaxID=153742 RepID=A0ABD3A7P8_9GENT
MGRRKNKNRSVPQIELVEGRKNGKDDDDDDDDDSTAEKQEEKIIEILVEGSDILLEVFSRLNPQTLFKFKSVSKGFCNFIGQAEFAAHHYRNCKAIAGRTLTGLFFQGKEQSNLHDEELRLLDKVDFLPVESEAGGIPDPSLEFLKQRGNTEGVEILDSCNGLLLCMRYTSNTPIKSYFVCNPLTKQKVALPNPKKPYNRISFALMADFDHNYLKYKVLCLFKGSDNTYSKLMILSSETTGDWMVLEQELPPVSYEFLNGSKAFFNGSLFWDCIEGHILVCDFNVNRKKDRCKLIEAPRAPLGRCLWKSEHKLHCYCHGFEDEYPEWTLTINDDGKQDYNWKPEKSEQFRNLTDDFSAKLDSDNWLIERKAKPRIQFKIISYAPESKTLHLFIPDGIYAYEFTERRLEFLGSFRHCRDRVFHSESCVSPYVHSLLPIQNTGRADGEAEAATEMKKVRGRHNKRTPQCQDYTLTG